MPAAPRGIHTAPKKVGERRIASSSRTSPVPCERVKGSVCLDITDEGHHHSEGCAQIRWSEREAGVRHTRSWGRRVRPIKPAMKPYGRVPRGHSATSQK